MSTLLRLLGVVAALGLCAPASGTRLCSYFNFGLDPQQMVPPTGSLGIGFSELHLCDDDSLRGHIFLEMTEVVTAVHIHGPAEPTENGPLLYELPLPSEQIVQVLLGRIPAVQREWLLRYLCYVDVHTSEHPDGAIRGLIHGEIAVVDSPWGHVKRLYR